MISFLKKTILLLTLAGIVFLAGGVGVVRAEETTSAPSKALTALVAVAPPPSNVLSAVDRATVDAQKTFEAVECGNWYSFITPWCWMPIFTYRIYQAVSLILSLSGSIFDFMLALSIDKVFIDQVFVHEIWKVMRDVANMMFIFILLYAGIRTMLLGDDWKKPVMNVVIIALLINFSLFFTNIVIDAGNTLALGVYSSMGGIKTTGSHIIMDGNKKQHSINEHNISETLVDAFAPQKFLELSGDKQNLAPTVFIIAGVISGVAAWIFFKAAFLFMGRILAFWFLMMWSPIAFIMFASPQLAKQAKFSFDDWLQMLINQAFVAPVFLFMIYIIMKFVEKGKLLNSLENPTGVGYTGFFFDNIFTPIVVAAMIIYALKKSLSVAESMAGWFGKIGANLGNQVLGIGLGMASGGATMAIGGAANKLLQSDRLQKMAKGEGTGNQFIDKWGGKSVIGKFAGRQGVLLADETRNLTFDPRNIKLGGIGKGLGAGTGNKDGFMQKEAKWMKEQDRKVKLMETTKEGEEDAKKKESPEYAKASKDKERGERQQEEAERNYSESKRKMESSEQGQYVKKAEQERSSYKMEGDKLVDKLERLKKEFVEAKTVEQRDQAEAYVNEAKKEMEKNEENLLKSEVALKNEMELLNRKAEGLAFSSASIALKEAKAKVADADRRIEEGTKKMKKMIDGENARRREIYGKSATWTHPSSWWNRAKTVDRIRTGPSEKEKADEDMSKWWKKMTEKEKKERGEPPTTEEKSEKPKEEGPLETK